MTRTVSKGDAVSTPGPLDSHAEWELPAAPGTVGTIRTGVREFAREGQPLRIECRFVKRQVSPSQKGIIVQIAENGRGSVPVMQ